jgi:hypothetical protein
MNDRGIIFTWILVAVFTAALTILIMELFVYPPPY